MGTEVQFKSFFPRYYSTRDINEDLNGCNWPLYYTDQTSPNGHLSNSFQWVTAAADASLDYDKFSLKRKMLEHEAVFKKQVHELHRLYRIQKDLMDEIKRKELTPNQDFTASKTLQASLFNGFSRSSKIGKEKFDSRLPAVVYIDLEESGESEVKAEGFDLNQPAQMDDTTSSEFAHPRDSSFFENMARAHQGSSNRGRSDSLSFKEMFCVSSQQKHILPNKIHEIPHLSNDHHFIVDRTRLLPTCGAESSKHWDSGVASHVSKHQLAASHDREKSSFRLLLENQLILRTSLEKSEQIGSPISGKSLKNAVIDINLPCEDLIAEEPPSTQRSTLKCEFDLNSCIDEDDTYDVAVDGRKMGVEIDLEAPAFADTEEGVCLEETAAEAIVAMSSTVVEAEEVLCPENLLWFVNIALRDQKKKKKMDYFESMTLELTEMDEEEHLPKAFEVEDDEMGPAPTNTSRSSQRRGQRRRGRQQRMDFQRDVLPGLTSLSRQEVAEDLQAFGGLMRATGHVWGPFGSSSRKGSSRGGRRRTIARSVLPAGPTETTIDMVRVEEVSLLGWGKTRRPRQQRCPAGNIRSTPMNESSSLLACGGGGL